MNGSDRETIILTGDSLSLEQLVRIARYNAPVSCDATALQRVRHNREELDSHLKAYSEWYPHRNDPKVEKPAIIYGVTTGFGELKRVDIDSNDLKDLQQRIIMSHAVGIGYTSNPSDPANYFPAEIVRAALALRLNAFLKGVSGVRRELVDYLAALLNAGIIPLVPVRGSVGASGDLCPLAHLFLPLLGHGSFTMADQAWNPRPGSELTEVIPLEAPGIKEKEGLALTNGAAFSAAMLALAVEDAHNLAIVADISAAVTLEAMCGQARAFDPKVHRARGFVGQQDSAANILSILKGSQLVGASSGAGEVQDAYSLRCAPQVHGASRDAVAYGMMVVDREINAATDNPLFFDPASGDPCDTEFADSDKRNTFAYSQGNFHGQPLALAADFLSMSIAELANIAERRIQMLLDSNHNRQLPACLVRNAGLNSGLMIAQYAAAALVSENKVLAHPACVDSIPTSANVEDHVSMATHAARKLLSIVLNCEAVLAIELLCAAEAVEWRALLSRGGIPAVGRLDERTPEGETISDARKQLLYEISNDVRMTPEAVAGMLGVGSSEAYRCVRSSVNRLLDDRPLDGDIAAIRQLIGSGVLRARTAAAVKKAEAPLRLIRPLIPSEEAVM